MVEDTDGRKVWYKKKNRSDSAYSAGVASVNSNVLR